MDKELAKTLRSLRKLTSSEAANWLLENYPPGEEGSGYAVSIIPHLSWKRPEQFLLARTYITNLPHAADGFYKAFSSFMSFKNLITVFEEKLPVEETRIDLLEYYLNPILKDMARTDEEKEALGIFQRNYFNE